MSRSAGKAMSEIAKNLSKVRDRIAHAIKNRPICYDSVNVRLVAVGKTKPSSQIQDAYNAGQRNFGENYVNELVEKSRDDVLNEACPDIKWHFIGHLQSNKVNKITTIPNLYMIETIDSEKLANAVNKSWQRVEAKDALNVMVQVNTSGEDQKSGINPSEAHKLVDHIRQNCPSLMFKGLMTIGAMNYDLTLGPNPDFQQLIQCRKNVAEKLGLNELDIELSMGMSNDFEHAIENGSSNIRVGSTIFGARQYNTT
ncbi:DgyrCDS973 [Dimorphilus gyrociliatus]|uniref:Pyridoxal phosphate homeostasis protein n=1 Tax=Dimorphilus gyrociliatus TaxID=2664684 RepID=A0A7I8VAX5_9ANNE|nr:DgyrCDS973 [Dimorphilus gyrociliatus]